MDDGKLITIWSNVFEITGAEFIYSTGDGGGLHAISATAPAPAISVNIPSDAASGWLNVRTLDRCVISTPRVYFGGN